MTATPTTPEPLADAEKRFDRIRALAETLAGPHVDLSRKVRESPVWLEDRLDEIQLELDEAGGAIRAAIDRVAPVQLAAEEQRLRGELDRITHDRESLEQASRARRERPGRRKRDAERDQAVRARDEKLGEAYRAVEAASRAVDAIPVPQAPPYARLRA